jgi:signal transduction histidine kinase
MRAIDSPRPDALELSWFAFALANVGAMALWPDWETIPFHLIWVSLTLLYGFRVWRPAPTYGLLSVVAVATGGLILIDAFNESQPWGELFEVPLMSAMFLAMVWHARRRQDALRAVEREAEERESMLERQERFLHDVSHELRTPVTIARGHLEVFDRIAAAGAHEIGVALDELDRIEKILARLLLLAKAERPDFVVLGEVDLEPFLEDVFMRWSEVAPRVWRLGSLPQGLLRADPDALRTALDALLENAVKYTTETEAIELSARALDGEVMIEITDEGCGIPAEALEHIFHRFARADAARTRARGGVGLGLAIVDAIAKAHQGGCSARTYEWGSTFSLQLADFRSAPVARAGQENERRALPADVSAHH